VLFGWEGRGRVLRDMPYCKLNLQMQKVDLRKLIVFFDLPKSSLSADVVVASFQLKAWPRVLLVRCRLVAISIGLVVN